MKSERAIVIGGSIAGLLAARALSNHYASVVVLERDGELDSREPRKGVPQANHVHVLLDSGLQALEHYFPGIINEMVGQGVERLAWSEDIRWFQGGSWKTRQPCGLSSYPQGRVGLERRIRERLLLQPGVELRAGVTALGLLTDPGRQTVTGARIAQDGAEADLAADLVVDAAGRGSRALAWLADLGYPAPPSETLPIDLVYVSRVYRRPAGERDWKGLACHPLPGQPRGGIILPLDSEHWIVTLFGYLGHHPATDEAGFMQFVRELPVPDLYETLSRAEPVSEPVRYAYPQQVRRRYDRAARFPDGFLVTGDALCSVDPVFGQGMTLACKSARLLDRTLASAAGRDPSKLRRTFFRDCQRMIEVPWLITLAEALRFPGMPGARTPTIRLLQWYTGHVFDLSSQSNDVYRAFLDVMHLTAGPTALFRPAVLRRVAARALRRKSPA